MDDPIVTSAIERDKPVAARRVRALLDELTALRAREAEAWEQAGSDRAELNIIGLELDALRARLALAERIVHIAKFWSAHDAGLLGAIIEWEA